MMKAKYLIAAALAACTLGSCSDMLETSSDRVAYDPALDNKVDSMFYTLGALKAVQQATDQYVLTNELRGDLATPTSFASTDLQELYKFNVSNTNKYDSAYVYYRVINNCNYYIAHRDTTLATGSDLVAMKEYAEAHALRAWAYLQLARVYSKNADGTDGVPFYTKPLTDIASIENVDNQPVKNIEQICNELAPALENLVAYPVPNWGEFNAGTVTSGENSSVEKKVQTRYMMIPVRVILADLYLEAGQYEKAAKHFFDYLKDREMVAGAYVASYMYAPSMNDIPSDLRNGASNIAYTEWYNETTGTSTTVSNSMRGTYQNIFGIASTTDLVTLVPFATNKLRGTISELPRLFGHNFYSTSDGEKYNHEVAIKPSTTLQTLVSNQDYYYNSFASGKVSSLTAAIGDMRFSSIYDTPTEADTFSVMNKFAAANVPIYRTSGIYLKLAEAVNRMGHPDVAFAVLKDGLNSELEDDTLYMTTEGLEFLKSGVTPFLSDENVNIFNGQSTNPPRGSVYGNTGIHARGCGQTGGNESLYQFSTEVQKKWKEAGVEALAQQFQAAQDAAGEEAPENQELLQAKIDAVEDLICDEMALELAFEGSRFSDLMRMAKHKNASNPWGDANYGWKWLDRKLAAKNLGFSFESDITKRYLPFQ